MKNHALALCLVVLSTLTACSPMDDFVGLWSTSGTMTSTINLPDGQRTTINQAAGNYTISEGTSSDIILTLDSSCSIPMDVDGNVATVKPGYACSVTSSNSAVMTLAFTTSTLSAAKNSLTFTSNGSVSAIGGGKTVTGNFNMSQTLSRLGK